MAIGSRPSYNFAAAKSRTSTLGKKLLLKFAEDLTGVGAIEGQPRLEGRNAHVIISPVKGKRGFQKEEGRDRAERSRSNASLKRLELFSRTTLCPEFVLLNLEGKLALMVPGHASSRHQI